MNDNDPRTHGFAVTAFRTFFEAAAIAGIKAAYPVAGTLLGCVRDSDFCPGDADDIDIAVFDEEFDKMGMITEGSWFRVTDRFIYKERVEGVKLELWHNPVHIDVCRARRHPVTGDRYDVGRFGIDNKQVILANVYPARCFRHLETTIFHGIECQIPCDAEYLLEYRYGPDWRTPVHRDHWDWASKIPSQAIRIDYDVL